MKLKLDNIVCVCGHAKEYHVTACVHGWAYDPETGSHVCNCNMYVPDNLAYLEAKVAEVRLESFPCKCKHSRAAHMTQTNVLTICGICLINIHSKKICKQFRADTLKYLEERYESKGR